VTELDNLGTYVDLRKDDCGNKMVGWRQRQPESLKTACDHAYQNKDLRSRALDKRCNLAACTTFDHGHCEVCVHLPIFHALFFDATMNLIHRMSLNRHEESGL